VRKLKGLEEIIPFTSVHWHMAEKGMLIPESQLSWIGV
jgi:glutathionyl-hydroquinone reductase